MTELAGSCSCTEFRTSRRTLLTGLAAVAGSTAMTGTFGGVFRQVAFGATGANVLVVLSLRGGADGLSIVVPYGDPGYAQARPHIGIPPSQLLATDGFFGLHPAFEPLLPMWNGGQMAAVHAVGLPQPNRSHFAALEELEDADPGSSARIGWLNRLLGLDAESLPWEAVNVGSAMVPTSLQGPQEVLGVQNLAKVGLPGGSTGQQAAWKRDSLQALWGDEAGPLGRAGRSALEASAQLGSLAGRGTPANGAKYPSTPLGDAARDTAKLIRAQLGVRAVTLDYGDWDMHAGLGTLAAGNMVVVLEELVGVLDAFFTDLGQLSSQVTVVTLSEFGRRVAENGDYGTDHGYGNVILALGGGVRGGSVYSRWPGLSDGDLMDGDLAVTRDYRSVLAEVLRSRFNVGSSTVFPNFHAEPELGFMM